MRKHEVTIVHGEVILPRIMLYNSRNLRKSSHWYYATIYFPRRCSRLWMIPLNFIKINMRRTV